jgi:4-amino-4-deoxy-L-arabinose transferase-like glycosyltransferase
MPPPMNDSGESTYRKGLLILLAITTLFRLFYIQWIELVPDESYYFTWSRCLQWGYYDHPPMVGFLIYLGTALAGMTELGVRLPWVIIGAILTFILYRMGSEMFRSERVGFYAALLMNISLLGSVGAIIATPDGPQALFWAWAIYFFYKAVKGEGGYFWHLTGIMLGLGLLSKYTMILFAPCALMFLLASAASRKWLLRKEPYLALLLGLLIFSPVILWNARHDWLSFSFQISHGMGHKANAGLRTFGEFWGGQAGLISPLVFCAVLWAMGKSAIQGFTRQKDLLLLLFFTSAPILFFFGFNSLRSRMEGNWPALAYFSALLALVGLTFERWPEWGKGKRALAWVAVGSALAFTVLVHLHSLFPFVPISPKKDPTSQLYGWRALGEKIEELASSIPPGEKVFLLTPSHNLVGESMFYTKAKYPVYQWDAPQRINHLSSTHAPPPKSLAIFFTDGGEELPQGLAPLFASCERLEPLTFFRKGVPVRVHRFWKCAGFKGFR